ncbi:MAG: hypothetical protein ACK4ME_02795 [Fimbriimonadales bacterium]
MDADAIRRALRDPNKRDEIRTLVLGEEWVNIPTILRHKCLWGRFPSL